MKEPMSIETSKETSKKMGYAEPRKLILRLNEILKSPELAEQQKREVDAIIAMAIRFDQERTAGYERITQEFRDAVDEYKLPLLTENTFTWLDTQDKEGMSPLLQALKHNHKDIAKRLLDAGANACVVAHDGATALHYASDPEILIELLKDKETHKLFDNQYCYRSAHLFERMDNMYSLSIGNSKDAFYRLTPFFYHIYKGHNKLLIIFLEIFKEKCKNCISSVSQYENAPYPTLLNATLFAIVQQKLDIAFFLIERNFPGNKASMSKIFKYARENSLEMLKELLKYRDYRELIDRREIESNLKSGLRWANTQKAQDLLAQSAILMLENYGIFYALHMHRWNFTQKDTFEKLCNLGVMPKHYKYTHSDVTVRYEDIFEKYCNNYRKIIESVHWKVHGKEHVDKKLPRMMSEHLKKLNETPKGDEKKLPYYNKIAHIKHTAQERGSDRRRDPRVEELYRLLDKVTTFVLNRPDEFISWCELYKDKSPQDNDWMRFDTWVLSRPSVKHVHIEKPQIPDCEEKKKTDSDSHKQSKNTNTTPSVSIMLNLHPLFITPKDAAKKTSTVVGFFELGSSNT